MRFLWQLWKPVGGERGFEGRMDGRRVVRVGWVPGAAGARARARRGGRLHDARRGHGQEPGHGIGRLLHREDPVQRRALVAAPLSPHGVDGWIHGISAYRDGMLFQVNRAFFQ